MTRTAFAAVLLPFAAFAAMPSVTSVTMSQNPVSRLVTVEYALSSAADAIVTLDILTNNVSIGAENIVRASGDVNRLMSAGTNGVIYWAADVDWPDRWFTDGTVKASVKAWSRSQPPDYMVVDLDLPEELRFYVSEAALPEGGLANDIYRRRKLVMRRIPAAGVEWTMGSQTNETGRTATYEKPHRVTLTEDFYIGIFEMTVAQCRLIHSSLVVPFADQEYELTDMIPSTSNRMSSVYGHAKEDVYRKEYANTVCYRLKHNLDIGIDFSLPTSAQWEFACKAGCASAIYTGKNADGDTLEEIAWHSGNSDGKLHRVGLKKPNAYGLYDMIGNAAEMVVDRWIDDNTTLEYADPHNTLYESSSNLSEVRGGSAQSTTSACRSASRAKGTKVAVDPRSDMNGFRLIAPIGGTW